MDADELDEAEEVFDVVFPARDESSEVVHPGKEPFDLPSFLIASQLAPVLGDATVAAVGANHLNAVFVFELLVEFVGVVCLVADQSSGQFVEKASGWSGVWSGCRTSSTSLHSAGEALATDTAKGRLLPAATATIFVPLPRRVGPTAKPPFSRSRRWHRRTLPPG